MAIGDRYIEATEEIVEKVDEIIEETFDKMSNYCKFVEKLSDDPDIKDCLYNGRPAAHVCDRDLCPILDEE